MGEKNQLYDAMKTPAVWVTWFDTDFTLPNDPRDQN